MVAELGDTETDFRVLGATEDVPPQPRLAIIAEREKAEVEIASSQRRPAGISPS
jgi:hypothetical protein